MRKIKGKKSMEIQREGRLFPVRGAEEQHQKETTQCPWMGRTGTCDDV